MIFTDTSSQPTYVAGKRVCTHTFPPPLPPQKKKKKKNLCTLYTYSNLDGLLTRFPRSRFQTSRNAIFAHVRHGPSRSQEDYNDLCKSIHEAWDRIVLVSTPTSTSTSDTGTGTENAAQPPKQQIELHTLFIFGDIVADRESGMTIPPAGADGLWLREHIGEFRRRAEGGDEAFEGLVREMGERGVLE